jgi:signal transduction histidine kinase/CheY-like chemotaxis protein
VQNQVLLASYYLRDPRPEFAQGFRAEGDDVFRDLRGYLFRDLSAGERAQVEEIKSLHQELEATAQLVFDLVHRGDERHARLEADRLVEQSQRLRSGMERLMAVRWNRLAELRTLQHRVVQQMYAAMGALSLLLLLAIFCFTRVVQARLLRPLDALARAAALLGEGNFGARVRVARADELGAVGERFNEMADRLQAAREELEARNLELSEAFATLRRTRQEAVQSEKLTALGGMLAGLAHELNNPLASVVGYAEMLHLRAVEAPGEPAPAWVGGMTAPIMSEALRARDLVRNLLQFSRAASPVLGPVDLADALQVAVNLRRYAFQQANLRLVTEVAPGTWVMAEAQRLQQVLLNLINNGYDALTDGGGSMLRVRAAAVPGGEWVEVVVEDDGPGLAEPERIFDPFYTTKPVGKGTGLGLSLVHRMAHDFGGTVEAHNAAAGGACFVLRLQRAGAPPLSVPAAEEAIAALPAARRPQVAAAAPSVPLPAPRCAEGPVRVLVVDDEEPIRRLQRRLLSMDGMQVATAASGAEAVSILERESVDLVVSDVKMPGEIGGMELYQWVLAARPHLADRFVFITGDVYGGAVTHLAGAEPDRFLAKPFQAGEYLDHIRRVLARNGGGHASALPRAGGFGGTSREVASSRAA